MARRKVSIDDLAAQMVSRAEQGIYERYVTAASHAPRPYALVSFDQALANTGLVIIDLDMHGELINAGKIVTPPSDKGHRGTIERAGQLHAEAIEILTDLEPPVHVLIEMPPVAKGRMKRPESSLAAALALAMAVDRIECTWDLVSAQAVKTTFTGNPGASKSQMATAIKTNFPEEDQLLTGWKCNNEHVRDAYAQAVHWVLEQGWELL